MLFVMQRHCLYVCFCVSRNMSVIQMELRSKRDVFYSVTNDESPFCLRHCCLNLC